MTTRTLRNCLAALIVVIGLIAALSVQRIPLSLAERAGCTGLMVRPVPDQKGGAPDVTVMASYCVDAAGTQVPQDALAPGIARAVWEHLDRPVDRITVHHVGGADSFSAVISGAELAAQSAPGSEQPLTRAFDLRRDGLAYLLPALFLLVVFVWYRAAKAIRSAGVVIVMFRS